MDWIDGTHFRAEFLNYVRFLQVGEGSFLYLCIQKIGNVHQLVADADYLFAVAHQATQVFRARKSDVDNIGVCVNRTLHLETSKKVNEINILIF